MSNKKFHPATQPEIAAAPPKPCYYNKTKKLCKMQSYLLYSYVQQLAVISTK